MFGLPEGYITGLGRSVSNPRVAHIYKGTLADPGWPMCRYGWNRDDGQSYSIWRNNIGYGGICQICTRRVEAGLDPVPPKGYDPSAPVVAEEEWFCPDGTCQACDLIRAIQKGEATWADLDKIDADGISLSCQRDTVLKGVID